MEGQVSSSPPPAGWYDDPARQSSWRWWDGRQWTGWVHPPAAGPAASVSPASYGAEPPQRPAAEPPAAPVPANQRRRLAAELLLVLAVFPLPYVVSAVVDLVSAMLGNGPGQRTPVLIRGHAGASFPLELVLILLPFAAAGLVAYLLSIPGAFGAGSASGAAMPGGEAEGAPPEGPSGRSRRQPRGEGGLRSLGLDLDRWKGDAALVWLVFVLCELIPIYGGAFVLRALGVHGVIPSTSGGPGYFVVLDVLNGITSGIVEEIVVLGFLVRRLEQLELPGWAIFTIAVAVRGSYHLYYGWDVIPILVWAAVTVVLYRRYRRLLPFIVVHVVWDTSLFLAEALGVRTGGYFLFVEAGILVPLSLILFLLWRNRIPRPASAPPRRR